MLLNTSLLLGIFKIENGDHQDFSRLKMVENTWQPLVVFWIGNFRKCLVAARHSLGYKSLKMPIGHHVFLDRKL
jgi:hypothetical protein